MKRNAILTVLCGLLLAAAGCDAAGYLGYLLAPEPGGETVPADYDNLPGNTVAPVVFCRHALQFEYPTLQLEMTSVLARELREKVEDVTVVDPMAVVRYQGRNINWDSLPKTKLAEELGADYVLLVSVVRFSMRDPRGPDVLTGRAVAEVSLYRASSAEDEARVRHYGDLGVEYAPISGEEASRSANEARFQMQRLLAEEVVRKFYEHKMPAGQEGS